MGVGLSACGLTVCSQKSELAVSCQNAVLAVEEQLQFHLRNIDECQHQIFPLLFDILVAVLL